MDEWIRWGAGILIAAIAGLVWYEIRRVGSGVHKLRTEVGAMVLRLEADVRATQRDLSEIKGRLEEASQWRDMVLELIRGHR